MDNVFGCLVEKLLLHFGVNKTVIFIILFIMI